MQNQKILFTGPNTTNQLIQRYINLISKGITPDEILFLCFKTEPIKDTIVEFLQQNIKTGFKEEWILDYSAFAKRVLRKHYVEASVAPDFEVLSGFEERLILEKVLKNLKLEVFENVKQFPGFINEMVNIIDSIKLNYCHLKLDSGSQSVVFTQNLTPKPQDLEKIFNKYTQETKKRNLLDFRDLLIKQQTLFDNHKNILDIYRKKFKYILVDAIEDISIYEYNLLLTLCKDCKNLYFAGDKQISVLKFRGAAPSIYMDNLAKEFELEIENLAETDPSIVSEILQKEIRIFNTEVDELTFIIRKIRDLVRNKECDFKDCVILRRDLSDIAQVATNICRELHVPFEMYYGAEIFSYPIIVSIMKKLREQDRKNFTRVDIVLYDKILKPIYKEIIEEPDEINKVNAFYKIVKDFAQMQERLGNKVGVQGFINFFDKMLTSYNIDIKLPNDNKNVVRIMTIHNSKGLAFKNVFLTGLAEGIFPRQYRTNSILTNTEAKNLNLQNLSTLEEFIEEEQRIFNLAITRATKHLTFSYAKKYGINKNLSMSSYVLKGNPSAPLCYPVIPQCHPERSEGSYKTDIPIYEQEINYTNCFDSDIEKVQTKEELLSFKIKNNLLDNDFYKEDLEDIYKKVEHLFKDTSTQKDIEEIWEKFVFSATSINTYKKCPRKFFFNYLLKIKQSKNPYSTFGNLVHKVLEEFHKKYKNSSSMNSNSKKDLNGVIEKVWEEKGKDFDRTGEATWFKKQAQKLFDDYLKDLEEQGQWNIEHLEEDFYGEIDKNKFKARIDRIDKDKNGLYEIIDYKTGSSTKLEKALKTEIAKGDNFQLPIYYFLALQKLENKLTKLSIYWLKRETKKKATLDPDDPEISELLSDAKTQITEIIKKIKTQNFEKLPKDKNTCNNCDYNSLC